MLEPVSGAPAEAVAVGGRSWIARVLRSAVALPALGFIASYLWCAAQRWSFPWELEWMEGGMITHAARVLRGLPIYAEPSIDFIAFFYTPLYAYVLAALSFLTGGLSFALGRGVSIGASLATLGMLFYAGRREGGWLAGVLAAGFYAASFRICGAFYDLARVDSLSLAFVLAASLIASYKRSYAGAIVAAACVVLAFFTKQTSAVVGAFIGLYLLTRNVRHAGAFAATGIVLALLAGLWLEHNSDGWFSFYTISGHQGHKFYWRHFLLEYFGDILILCPFVALIPVVGSSYRRRWASIVMLLFWAGELVHRALEIKQSSRAFDRELWYREPRTQLLVPAIVIGVLLLAARLCRRELTPRPSHSYFLVLYAGALLASDLNHSTQWAHSNCFMPVALFASLYCGLVVAALLEPFVASSRRELLGMAACACAVVIQLGALVYDPRAQVPSAADRAAARELIATLDRYPAPVFMGAHPLYSYLRDGTIHTHAMGFNDVARTPSSKLRSDEFLKREFATVIVDSRGRPPPGLKHAYDRVYSFSFEGKTLLQRTGFQARPTFVFLRRGLGSWGPQRVAPHGPDPVDDGRLKPARRVRGSRSPGSRPGN
jgi:hypothetical protein